MVASAKVAGRDSLGLKCEWETGYRREADGTVCGEGSVSQARKKGRFVSLDGGGGAPSSDADRSSKDSPNSTAARTILLLFVAY